jgi:16S rRNA (guanine(966)-N(2))-methyltransferase RsmD
VIRILGGMARGRKLCGPVGHVFRPTTGRVKEFIFSYLGSEVDGARFLDLFSGTGSLGLEALSRGAREVVFIEKSRKHVRIIHSNIAICRFEERARVIQGDVFSWLRKLEENGEWFDVILADPPFRKALRSRIVETVDKHRVLKAGGWLLVEHESHDSARDDSQLSLIRQRKFGHCVVSVYC